MLNTKENTRLVYTKIEPNIHYFKMAEASRKAVDEYIAILETLIQNYAEGEVMHTLMDSSVGAQPLSYIFSQIRNLLKQYPKQTRHQTESKLALILPAGPLVHLIEGLLRSFPQLRTRIYSPGEDHKAIAWLRE